MAYGIGISIGKQMVFVQWGVVSHLSPPGGQDGRTGGDGAARATESAFAASSEHHDSALCRCGPPSLALSHCVSVHALVVVIFVLSRSFLDSCCVLSRGLCNLEIFFAGCAAGG